MRLSEESADNTAVHRPAISNQRLNPQPSYRQPKDTDIGDQGDRNSEGVEKEGHDIRHRVPGLAQRRPQLDDREMAQGDSNEAGELREKRMDVGKDMVEDMAEDAGTRSLIRTALRGHARDNDENIEDDAD